MRVVLRSGSKLTINQIIQDFESFTGFKVTPQDMGYIMKKHGYQSNKSNGITVYKGLDFANTIEKGQTTIGC